LTKAQTFRQLYDFSVTRRNDFWSTTLKYFPLIHHGTCEKPVDESASIDSLPTWFPGIQMNFAENILYTQKPGTSGERSTRGKEDSKVAFIEIREGGSERRQETWGSLRERVAHMTSALKAAGTKKGDRIAVVASNSGDTLVVFLATAAIGAVFSSSSPDMGIKVGLFGQFSPGHGNRGKKELTGSLAGYLGTFAADQTSIRLHGRCRSV
jgi:acetoacetyl-CoA synthetase